MLSAFILINLFYISFIVWLSLFLYTQKNHSIGTSIDENDALSLIIPIRNEIDSIKNLISSLEILQQAFDKLEIFIVDDNSNDGSTEGLKNWEELSKKSRITVLYLSDGNPSKKKAINTGLEESKNNWIVQSDADCDLSVEWLKSLIKIDKSNFSLLAGPVAFKSNNFWSGFLKVESWALIVVSYLGFKVHKPQMCSAANLCWDKSKLGTDSYLEIINIDEPSGDDAFLLQYFKSKNPKTVKYSWDINSLVWTDAPKSFLDFINQRIRWASKWGAVKGISQLFFPLLLWTYHLMHFVLLIFLLSQEYYQIVLGVIFFKATFEMIMLNRTAKNFNQSVSIIHVIFMQILYSPYVVILGLLSQIAKYSWK